jgi:anthranilate synthase component II
MSAPRVALVDNYDSFTYNLVQYLAELGADVAVYRNDAVDIELLQRHDALVISPGPGGPADAGVSTAAIQELHTRMPILGVCLGHQCIGEAFGGRVVRTHSMHGKVSPIRHDGSGLFAGLPDPFAATRYHSLAVEPDSVPPSLSVTAWTDDGIVMGLRTRDHLTFGVQFHPESVLSIGGRQLLETFLELAA